MPTGFSEASFAGAASSRAQSSEAESSGARDVLSRNNVHVLGNPSGPMMVFGHGFGGSQESWNDVIRHFEDDFAIVLFDHVGSGESDVSAFDHSKYDSLHGYADDLLEIIETLDLHDVIYVGHSVGGIIGVLAANRSPGTFSHLVLVGPSPRYVDAIGYQGGFTQEAIDGLLDSLDSNYLGWSSEIAPVIMGNAERPELGHSLAESFSRVDPAIASQFARVTFLSDNRLDLPEVTVPTLVLQSSDDVIAPIAVGEYVHANIPGSELVIMSSRGHVPNLSDPAQVASHILAYLS